MYKIIDYNSDFVLYIVRHQKFKSLMDVALSSKRNDYVCDYLITEMIKKSNKKCIVMMCMKYKNIKKEGLEWKVERLLYIGCLDDKSILHIIQKDLIKHIVGFLDVSYCKKKWKDVYNQIEMKITKNAENVDLGWIKSL